MKELLIMILFVAGSMAGAADIYISNGKEISKLDAMRQLLVSKNSAKIQRCHGVYMNEKGNVVKIKKK